MSQNKFERQELDVLTDDRHCLGRDAKGRLHYCDAVLGVVWVVVDSTIAHIEQTRDIGRWVDYTTTQVGWDECRYDESSLAVWLSDALSGVTA